ncbi:MAG: hypothetical protein MJA27_36440 [Pseudanabaenales cyanobacterium]|nr:hypothetical protein [Pseudanabaenales cyanobacterium]
MRIRKVFRFLSRFFKYILVGQINPSDSSLIVPVEEVVVDPDAESNQQHTSREQVRNKLILMINRVLVVVCCVSFFVIIVYSFIYPDKSVPDIIQNSFFTTLGWFGGALGTFFQVEKSIK